MADPLRVLLPDLIDSTAQPFLVRRNERTWCTSMSVFVQSRPRTCPQTKLSGSITSLKAYLNPQGNDKRLEI